MLTTISVIYMFMAECKGFYNKRHLTTKSESEKFVISYVVIASP